MLGFLQDGEALEAETKKFEDLEFQQLERESSLEEERETRSQQLLQERAEYHSSVAKRKVRRNLLASRPFHVPSLCLCPPGEDLSSGDSGRPAGPAGVSGGRAAAPRTDAGAADAAQGEGETVRAGEELPQPERREELPQVLLDPERGEWAEPRLTPPPVCGVG